jgi:hypothetical protein
MAEGCAFSMILLISFEFLQKSLSSLLLTKNVNRPIAMKRIVDRVPTRFETRWVFRPFVG